MSTQAPAQPDPQTSLDKGYEPARVEAHWAAFWEQEDLFHAEDSSDKPAYSIVLPPPNVTGSLHIGHALTVAIQDILIRYKRMSGYNTCWLPGIDHAGIATQMVVERELFKSEKKTRHDLGREEFLKRVWAWKEQSGGRISQQHRALGASLDWARERFTMDAQSSKAVREAFVRLHADGLLYRAERLINWCPRCRTALSDLEVEHEEAVKGELYRFAYKLAAGQGLDESGAVEIVVATTRVETMLGDTAVAVHPDDPRYQHLVGKRLQHPFLPRTIPIIADGELVDPKFGTGAVKVTPAHSFEDFESGKRHALELINILNLDGTLNEKTGQFAGQDRIKVRRAIKEALAALGLERGSDPHTLALGRCQRCDNVVEPMLSKQWFVKVKPLADKVIAAVDAGEIQFVPESWKAEFYRWMTNLHDWCISRQLWWGHQIPAWYGPDGEVLVAREKPAGRDDLRQDEDVLDTWFSSGLWPFSTFGWPDKTAALQTFYPNSVMETGFDILFFWVARMAMMGLHLTGEVPFRTVFLHAMVRDEKGEKMSKTRGNVIDPLVITEKYGADALRFTLASMAAQGRDIKLAVDRIQANKAFANKVWNAARYVLMYAGGYDPNAPAQPSTVYDRWILSRLQRCAEATQKALDEYRFSDAALGVYRFIWNELCDWAIELSKPALQAGKLPDGAVGADGATGKVALLTPEQTALKASAVSSLLKALEGALRLLHPFMPFVTEEVWQRLPKPSGAPRSIMLAAFPGRTEAEKALLDPEAEREMDLVSRAIDGARSVRGEVNLPPNQRVPIWLVPTSEATKSLLQKHVRAFQQLANAAPVTIGSDRPAQAAAHVEPELEVHLPLAGLIDFGEEQKRVDKELVRLAAEREGMMKRLNNEGFVARAPREVVEKDRARADELRAHIEKLTRHRERVASWRLEMATNDDQTPQDMNNAASAAGAAQPVAQPATQASAMSAPTAPVATPAGQLLTDVKKAAQQAGENLAELATKAVASAKAFASEAQAAVQQGSADATAAVKAGGQRAAAQVTSGASEVSAEFRKDAQAVAVEVKRDAKALSERVKADARKVMAGAQEVARTVKRDVKKVAVNVKKGAKKARAQVKKAVRAAKRKPTAKAPSKKAKAAAKKSKAAAKAVAKKAPAKKGKGAAKKSKAAAKAVAKKAPAKKGKGAAKKSKAATKAVAKKAPAKKGKRAANKGK